MRLALKPLVILFVLAVGATSVLAADAEIFWAASWKDAVAEAKERGAKIVVVLTMDGEPANEAQMEVWRNDKSVAKAAGAFVCLFACRGNEHGQDKVRVDGKQVTRCRIAKTIPCSVHQTVEGFVVSRFGEVFIDDEGNVRTPVQFLVDADGKVLETFAVGSRQEGFDVVTGADLAGQLEAAAKKHGAGLDRAKIEKFKKEIAVGDDLFAKKKYAEAAEQFDDVAKGAPEGMALKAIAEKKLAEIAALGQVGIEEGRALAAAKKYGEAIARLERVKKEFAKTSAATDAGKALDEIDSDPAVKKLMGDRAAQAASSKLLASAQGAEKKRKWAQALASYEECAAKYGSLPAGAAAKTRAEEIRADEKLMAEIRETAAAKDCKKWIRMAENYIGNGLKDKARTELQKVIDKYPGTSYAEKAKKLLGTL